MPASSSSGAGRGTRSLCHYFPTKSDLYLAAVRAAAEELRAATTAPTDLPPGAALVHALTAHVDWIDANADAYRAVLQGGLSSDVDVQAIVEESRADVVARLARGLGFRRPTAAQRTVLRGWVGFLEGACLHWRLTHAARVRRPGHVSDLEAAVPQAERWPTRLGLNVDATPGTVRSRHGRR